MKYLLKTNDLLLEPSFLMFARQVYEGFCLLDEGDFIDARSTGATFEMTMESWYMRSASEKLTRVYSDAVTTFGEYVGYMAQGRIRADWQAFEEGTKEINDKAKRQATGELLAEAREVSEIIKNTPYLKPILNMMEESLESILNHYPYQSSPTTRNNNEMDQPQRTKLIWRADASVLVALFLDLRNKELKHKHDKYISVGDKELVDFIESNFVFYDKDNQPVEMSRKNLERYVSGDDMATRIGLDFSNLRR